MFSLYRDPKGEHVIPASLTTTSDVKRSMTRSKWTPDQNEMEAIINMYKNKIQELEDQVAQVYKDKIHQANLHTKLKHNTMFDSSSVKAILIAQHGCGLVRVVGDMCDCECVSK